MILTVQEALEGLVQGLVTEYRAEGGLTLPGRQSLLDALDELSLPSQSLVSDPNAPSTPPRRAGSPAPWSAGPAELLDEIERGSIDLVLTARRVLGLAPPTMPASGRDGRRHDVPLTLVEPGSAVAPALRALPDLHRRIRSRRDLQNHWLVRVELADGTLEAGEIEVKLRRWHHRAAVVVGMEQRPLPVGQVPNPWHPENAIGESPARGGVGWWRGPTCHHNGSLCDHDSCRVMRWSRTHRWVDAVCPWCERPSLLQSPSDGSVYCGRPSCRDSAGRRPSWSVAELRRLGSLVSAEVRSDG